MIRPQNKTRVPSVLDEDLLTQGTTIEFQSDPDDDSSSNSSQDRMDGWDCTRGVIYRQQVERERERMREHMGENVYLYVCITEREKKKK